MRKSRTINLLLLGGGMFAFCACLCSGCGRNNPTEVSAPYDPPWHDANGNAIAKEWNTDADGHRTPTQPPYDANGKPIAFDANGNPVPPAGTTHSGYSSSSSHYHRTGGWFPYIFSTRSTPSYGPTYRSGPTNTGSTYFGGSKPNSSSPPAKSSGGSSSSGSVSRGGFGGSAASASSGS
ncbi:hypothetical protein [Limnoglobus roseus]|uniref:Secreted protein n=1 Tax=Limnoglobus roseus TaxID=2598579 RepID=A0A5C1A9V9_9BACT|nr:hypothetical protein [Limnoglobus roseus]QEL15355.1 hypothetical protein PX52LOC_02270 [Limnoglobus roseus]